MADTAQLTQQQQEAVNRLSILANALDVTVPSTITPEFAQDINTKIQDKIKALDTDGDGLITRGSGRSKSTVSVNEALAAELVDDSILNILNVSEDKANILKSLQYLNTDMGLILGDAAPAPVVTVTAPPVTTTAVDSTQTSSASTQTSVQSTAPAFTPDAQTKAAMTYICLEVFPSIGIRISDPTNVTEFTGCYDKAIGSLKDLAGLSDDPSKHAAELKAKLDELAQNPDLDKIRATNAVSSAAASALLGASSYSNVIPPAMLKDPTLLLNLIDNRDRLVQTVQQVNDSGMFAQPAVAPATAPAAAPATTSTTSTTSTSTTSDQTTTTTTTGAGTEQDSTTTQTTTTTGGELTAEEKKAQLDGAIYLVESLLIKPVGDKVGSMGDQVSGLAEKFVDFKPLAESDLGGEFASDQFRLIMIGLKKMDGQQNPNGAYDPSQREGLIKSILEKPEFEMVRQQLQVDPSITDAAKIKEERRKQLDMLFNQMDILYANGLTDTEAAKNDTVYNRVLMKVAEYIPDGFKDTLRNFFEGSEWGKTIGGVLGSMGIQVSLLWGEELKSESALLSDAGPMIEDGFKKIYEEADGTTPVEKIASIRASVDANMDNAAVSLLKKTVFKGVEGDVLKDAINAALDKAELEAQKPGATAESIAKAFKDEALVQAQEFRNNPPAGNVNALETLASGGAAADEELRQAVDQFVIEASADEKLLISFDKERKFERVEDRFAGDAPAAIYGTIIRNYEALDMSQNKAVIENPKGDGKVEPYFTPQGNAIIEELLIRATIHDHVKNGGEVNKEFIDHLNATDPVGHPGNDQYMPARELSMDNYQLIVQYMEDKGVAQEDIDIFKKNIEEIGTNYYGTNPADLHGGEPMPDSVLEHTVYGGQLKIEAFIPKPAPVVAPQPEPVAPPPAPVVVAPPAVEPEKPAEPPKPAPADDPPAVVVVPPPAQKPPEPPPTPRQTFNNNACESVMEHRYQRHNDAKYGGAISNIGAGFQEVFDIFKFDNFRKSYGGGLLSSNRNPTLEETMCEDQVRRQMEAEARQARDDRQAMIDTNLFDTDNMGDVPREGYGRSPGRDSELSMGKFV